MQSKSVGELVNQVGKLYMNTDINVSEFEKMKSYSEGVFLPSDYDTKVSASNLKQEISGKYLSMTKIKITKVKNTPLTRKQNFLVERIRDNSASKKKTKRVKWSKSITQKEVSIPNNVQPQQATILPPITKCSLFTKPLVSVKMSRDDIEQYSIVQAVKELLAFSSPLSRPKVRFDVSKEEAVYNFDLLKKAKFNLSDIINTKGETSFTTYGSKFKDVKMLEKLFKHHHIWKDLKLMIPNGSQWPIEELDEKSRLADLKEPLAEETINQQ